MFNSNTILWGINQIHKVTAGRTRSRLNTANFSLTALENLLNIQLIT